MNHFCLIIPVYNHPETIGWLMEQLATYQLHCILVNDGSDPECSERLRHLANALPTVELIERDSNGGKGAAVKTGLRHAFESGYTHAIQIDADGQHNHGDIGKFIATANQHPDAVISGEPVFENIPRVRFYARYLTHVWIWINTWSLDIHDSMCGFRVYPVAETMQIINKYQVGNRMDFDPEILVRLHWSGIKVIQLKTAVSYPRDGISHFRGLLDNLLISRMHTVLFFGMLRRIPSLLARKHAG